MVTSRAEMILEWRDDFRIDPAAVNPVEIITVQDAVNIVARDRGIGESNSPLQGMLISRVRKAIATLKQISPEQILPDSKICRYLHPEDETIWSQFIFKLGALVPKFSLPYLPQLKAESRVRSLLHAFMPSLEFDGSDVTVQQMAEVLGASNLSDFVDMKFISSKFEIYLCIAHWLNENQRINYYEIGLQKEFEADFGLW